MTDIPFGTPLLPSAVIPQINGPVGAQDMVLVINTLIQKIDLALASGQAFAPVYTVATLPNSGLTIGQRAFVSNGTVATGFGVVPSGSGAVVLPVYADTATTWKYG
jgi:hypothetical protein